jgi:hypothetical protein
MITEWPTGKDLEGWIRGLIEALFPTLPEETEENHEIFSQDNRFPNWDSNLVPPEYMARVLP